MVERMASEASFGFKFQLSYLLSKKNPGSSLCHALITPSIKLRFLRIIIGPNHKTECAYEMS